MSSNDNEDPTVPAGKFPDGPGGDKPSGDGSEDRTVPAGSAHDHGEDPTVASGSSGNVERTQAGSYDANDMVGKTIGGCRIDELLGRGAMGAVYKARQLKLERDVAVKVIRPEMMTDPRMLRRFEVEARTAGKFNSANVVMVHDFGFEHGVHYLVMEFVEGQNLRAHAKLLAGGRLPAGDALPLIRQAVKGLEEARRLKVVHRDIKPDNLMLTTQNVLKIADFGIAKPEEDFSMTLTSELIGTPLYMSPEQCQGGADLDFRSDMYSLGATFFYLLTGEPPVRASSVYELIQTKTKLENLCLWKSLPELDENHPLSRVIERMTANDRDDRYESYEELLNDLLLVEAGETITVRAKRIKKEAREREERRAAELELGGEGGGGGGGGGRSGLVLVLLLLVAGGGGGYWWWQNQQKQGGGTGTTGNGTSTVANGGDTGNGPAGNGASGNGSSGNGNAGGAAGPDAAAVDAANAAMDAVRERMADATAADFEAMSSELASLQAPASLADRLARLRRDAQEGAAIAGKLAALVVPQPGDDLAPFVASVSGYRDQVESQAKASEGAGPELTAWAQKKAQAAVSSGEQQMTEAAAAALEAQRKAWQQRFAAFRGEADGLAKLQEELGGIRRWHSELSASLPGLKDVLAPEPFVGALDRSEIELIRTGFLCTGETAALRNQLGKVNPASAELIKDRAELFEGMQDYAALRVPTRFEAPEFKSVAAFRKDMAAALAKAVNGRSLETWLLDKQRALLQEGAMYVAVVEVCRDAWAASRQRISNEDYDGLVEELEQLEEAVANARHLFPDQDHGSLDRTVAVADIKQAAAGVLAAMEAEAGDKLVANWRAELRACKVGLAAVTLTTWSEAEFQKKQDKLREDLAAISDEAKRATLEPGLTEFAKDCRDWSESKAFYDGAVGLLAEGKLIGCLDRLKASPPAAGAKRDCQRLKELAEQCRGAFRLVQDELKVLDAARELKAAKDTAAGLSLTDAAQRIDAWHKGVTALKNASTGMKAVAAGKANKPGVEVVRQAFFISKTECSVDEFRSFQQKAAAENLEELAKRMPSFTGQVNKLRSAINMRLPTSSGSMPVSANWWSALAYCEWRKLALPTRSEWALAAFGDGQERKFPWGEKSWELAVEANDCNFGQKAVEVSSGGSQRDGLRHMAGNVAEWLAFDGNGFKAPCVGGGYKDTPRSAKKYAEGLEVRQEDREMSRIDVGFRTVLRPSTFAELVWPLDWRG